MSLDTVSNTNNTSNKNKNNEKKVRFSLNVDIEQSATEMTDGSGADQENIDSGDNIDNIDSTDADTGIDDESKESIKPKTIGNVINDASVPGKNFELPTPKLVEN